MIPLAEPSIGKLERRYVLEAIDSGYVSSVGAFVERFEEAFAAYVGSRHAVACSSGTAAIHVGLRVLGVGPDDLVAVPDFTFVGSANPVAYLGAVPLLVDSETRTWNLDASLLAAELDRRVGSGERLPAVVEVVHVLGQPAELEELLATCDRHGIPILEDAAESLGAGWTGGALDGRHTGTVGRLGAFSFNGNKIATTGGGGMLVTDDEGVARQARHLTTQAKVPGIGYLHDEVGYNYRLSNVAAAIGLAQLERMPEFLAQRRRIAKKYDEDLAGTGLVLPPRVAGLDPNHWLYSVLVPPERAHLRDQLLERLHQADVGARPLWRPLHAQPPYAGAPRLAGQVADGLFERGLSLPSSVDLTPKQQERVVEVLAESVSG